MVYFVSYFSRKDFAAAMAGMILGGDLARENAGLIGTMLFAFYGAGQLISGYLGDRIKPRDLILIGLSATAVCNILMPLIPEWAMIAVWGVNGLAQAMLWPPIVKLLSTYLDHKTYVSANLIVTSAAHVATIILYAYTPICLSFMTWDWVFYTATVLAVISAVVFAVALRYVLPDSPLGATDREPNDTTLSECTAERENILTVLRRSGVFTVFVCIVVCGFLRDGIESWLPTLYSEAFGRSASESTLLSIILPIFSIISITLITVLHKGKLFNNEVSGTLALFSAALASTLPLAILLNFEGRVFGFISLFLAAFICAAMHGVNFLLISCLPGRFAATGRAATVSGVCNSCIYVGAAISTYGIALISGEHGWVATVISWSVVLAVGIAFAILSIRRYTSMINKQH